MKKDSRNRRAFGEEGGRKAVLEGGPTGSAGERQTLRKNKKMQMGEGCASARKKAVLEGEGEGASFEKPWSEFTPRMAPISQSISHAILESVISRYRVIRVV